MIGSFDDIMHMETALLTRVSELIPEFEVKHFPQDGIIKTLHPQGTVAVRFAALQPGETNGRQTDRLQWIFEANVISRNLYTDETNVGIYNVLTRLFRGLHGMPVELPDGGSVDSNVSIIDLVTVEDGYWTYIVSLNLVGPYITG